MFASHGRRPSPALIVALVALIVALSGTGYAATQLSRNSVTSAAIKSGAVKRSDIGRNAVNSDKVADRSLRASDLAAGVLSRGRPGPPGEPG